MTRFFNAKTRRRRVEDAENIDGYRGLVILMAKRRTRRKNDFLNAKRFRIWGVCLAYSVNLACWSDILAALARRSRKVRGVF